MTTRANTIRNSQTVTCTAVAIGGISRPPIIEGDDQGRRDERSSYKLDKRFSDHDAAATSWDETRQALENAQLFWITTVRRDGRPQVTPLVAVWLDGALYFSTGPAEQKAVNLAHNPHVIFTTGCNRWDHGTDIVVEGDAVRVTDDEQLARLTDAWARKWDGRWRYTVVGGGFQHTNGGQALVFAVAPSKILAFGKGTFSQTRHRLGASPTR
jgi:nitroimidazol reductase NimA-like FMN-containing flavoprotein (pyridoxamine 5'-phosphate oxidase superfamily)